MMMNKNHVKTFGQFVNEVAGPGGPIITEEELKSFQNVLGVSQTGKLDSETVEALKGFQETHAPKVTGKFDNKTVEILRNVIKRQKE